LNETQPVTAMISLQQFKVFKHFHENIFVRKWETRLWGLHTAQKCGAGFEFLFFFLTLLSTVFKILLKRLL